uniref:hypothetical protein n=1 Tax=Caldalkalibacillus salinus TaxID=2803787 RepID=UPI001F1D9C15
VQDCFQLGVDFKELVRDEKLFVYKLFEYITPDDKEESRKAITRYTYDEVSSVDSFQLKYNPSHFAWLLIRGNFAMRFEKQITPNKLFIWIHQEEIHTSTI